MHHPDAWFYRETQQLEQAWEGYKEALAIRIKHLGQQHASVADHLQSLAAVCLEMKRKEDAALYCQRALILKKKLFGEDHPQLKGLQRMQIASYANFHLTPSD